ncbi:uncharacterized protein Nmag_3699 (plasmid) [Natrialba magadii ATCC 43099]|uniref:Halobacterial output domain-containing protein n=1 Tax=Natrialba magadii (strain ATCC 43099 / DSM 3394 / CCM 3739 / CIP 104546 / IAM 13178 / JCM 8861 / NBRC 102185 / NCIMB 2190 / MS3) TaxID=547559 RepID=D3T0Y2_NATMM|nr:HalOD1 output domain-containing protein [Natrialba magadii]ADD07241.1 uncharacterized protein Nmag_3699 [Natrialba magadii ATCC 43099]ELY34352.1 hypothetical protein C500_00417 [Natrialba magadii ATCC 43099]
MSHQTLASEQVSHRVVETVAEADGIDPTEVKPPLYNVVDPTALNRLFDDLSTHSRHGHVSFPYRDYTVTVHSSGRVELE